MEADLLVQRPWPWLRRTSVDNAAAGRVDDRVKANGVGLHAAVEHRRSLHNHLRRVLRFLLVDHDTNLSETFPMAHNTMKAETTTLEGRVAGRRSDGVAGPVRLE